MQRLSPLAPTVARFAAIGLASTLAYAVLYVGLRSVLSASVANALALVVTAVGNTAANRRFTFGVRGRDGLARDHAAGLTALAVALAITTAMLAVLHVAAPGAGRAVELAFLVAANGLSTVVRFLLLRTWIGSALTARAASTERITR